MRKRRRVDLAPRLGIGSAYPNKQADQADDGGPKHADGSSRATQPSWCAYGSASRLMVFTSLRSWPTVPRRTGSPAFAEDHSGGWRKKRPPYAFFFTSLTLEKVIPSARSRE